MALEVHASRSPVEHLHAIRADVAHTGGGIFREDERKRDETPAVVWPALENGQRVERAVAPHDFMARRVLDVLRQQVCEPAGEGNQLQRIEHALRHRRRQQLVDLARQIVERRNTQRQAHALHGSEGVRRHRHVETGRLLEEERRSTAR